MGLKLDERGAIVVDADCRPTCRASGRWATWCAARCWRTRPRRRAWRWPSASPASTATSTSTPSLGHLHQPEIAWVGQTEQQLKAAGGLQGRDLPFLANGRARALGDTTGMVKFLADAKTDEILGVHIVGPDGQRTDRRGRGGDGVPGQQPRTSPASAAHPSLSEATKEAALAVDKRTLNF